MMPSGFHFRNKVPVALLAATGELGQAYAVLLQNHPWFEIKEIFEQDDWAGQDYGSLLPKPVQRSLSSAIGALKLKKFTDPSTSAIIFDSVQGNKNLLNLSQIRPGTLLITPILYESPSIALVIPEIQAAELNQIDSQLSPLKITVFASVWMRELALLAKFLKEAWNGSKMEVFYSGEKGFKKEWKILIEKDRLLAFQEDQHVNPSEIILKFQSSVNVSLEDLKAKYSKFLVAHDHYSFHSAKNQYEKSGPPVPQIKKLKELAPRQYALHISLKEAPVKGGVLLAEYLVKKGKVFW